jgi:hypothetical protein
VNIYLAELIELLKAEQQELESAIENCVVEREFKQAHRHDKALRKVNRQLQTLYNLQDPSYEERQHLVHRMDSYKKFLADPKYSGMTDHFLDKMNEVKRQSSQQHKEAEQLDTQIIDECIYQVIERKIKSFKFNLYRKANLYLHFKLINNQLQISFTPFAQLKEDEYMLVKRNKKALKALGFIYAGNKEYLYYLYDLNGLKDALEIKNLLSRIVFEVYYFKSLDHPTTIEVEQ